MKMIIKIKSMKEAMTSLSKVIPSNPNLPILGAIKFSCNKEGLTVTATNLDETLSYDIQGEGSGSCILEFKEFKEYAKNCKDSLQLEDVGNKIAAVYHADNIPCIKQFRQHPLQDWPDTRALYKGNKVPAKTLECIQRAIPSAADKNDTKVVMKGILLEPQAVIATSGRELIKLHCNTGIKENTIIPVTKFIKSANFAKRDAFIAVEAGDTIKYCSITTDSWTYSTKCIEGNYPNYRQVIPKSSICSIELSGENIDVPLLDSQDGHNTVHLYADDKQVKVLSGTLEPPGLTVKGTFRGRSPVTVSVNRDMLIRCFELGFRKLSFQDGEGFGPVTASDGLDLYVFMPLRGEDSQKIKDAVVKNHSNEEKTITEENEKMPQENYAVENNRPGTDSNVPTQPAESVKPVTDINKGFTVVANTEKDPFDELLESIAETRSRGREVLEMTTELSRKVKSLRSAIKAKERDYKNTQDLITKLKKVSGF